MAEKEKSKEDLSRELSRIRSQLAAKVRLCRQQAQAIARLKPFREPSSKYARMLFDSMDEAFAVKEMLAGPDGRIDFRFIEVNPAFEKQSGLRNVVGRTMRETMPGLQPQLLERFATAIRTGEHIRFQDYVADLNRWFDIRAWPLGSPAKHRLAVLFTDITELRRSEEALRESEERFRIMADGLPLVVWVHDAEGRQQFVNYRFLEFFGVKAEEVNGVRWQALLHPDDIEAYTQKFRQCLSERRPFHAEVRVRRRDGQWRWIESWGTPRWSASGGFLGFVGTSADITERKRNEQSLRESQLETSRHRQFLQMLLDHAQACIAVLRGCELRYTLVNRAYQALRPDMLMIGHTYREVFPDAVCAGAESLARAVLETGEPREDHGYPMPIPGKPDAAWNQQIVRLPTLAGEEPSVLIITWDATEYKRAKDALQLLNETLEQQVSERTLLAESRTRQLQALAVELIEAEERERRRISTLLHDDLQQLLAAARFTLQTATHLDPVLVEVQRLLEEAIRKSRHLSHELSPAVLHQSGLDAALEWLCMHMREHFGLVVRLHTETDRPVQSRSLRVFLFRAVQELLFNIVKHAGVKSADVRFKMSEDDFTITVSDSGKGFDTAILDEYSPKAGLGLLSIRERASYIGGRMAIESGPGQGCRLTLCIPARMDEDLQPELVARDAVEKKRVPAEVIKIAGNLGIRVLFADDHKVMRQGLIRLLTGKPDILVVGEAANGRQALELTRQLRPDVVVMDVSMPEMDGIEATRRIKAELPQVRVIGLSMHEDEHVSRTMREAGAETFVNKAASSAELLNAIYGHTWLKGEAKPVC